MDSSVYVCTKSNSAMESTLCVQADIAFTVLFGCMLVWVIFFSFFIFSTFHDLRIVRLLNAFRCPKKFTVDKWKMEKIVWLKFFWFRCDGNLFWILENIFFWTEMDNVHFALDNYDLPLCNLCTNGINGSLRALVCVCVCLYDTNGSVSFRFVYGPVRTLMTVGSQSTRTCTHQCGTEK